MEHFSPKFTRSDVHPFKLLRGMQMWTILKLLGGYSQIIGRIYVSIPPCFGTTGGAEEAKQFNSFK